MQGLVANERELGSHSPSDTDANVCMDSHSGGSAYFAAVATREISDVLGCAVSSEVRAMVMELARLYPVQILPLLPPLFRPDADGIANAVAANAQGHARSDVLMELLLLLGELLRSDRSLVLLSVRVLHTVYLQRVGKEQTRLKGVILDTLLVALNLVDLAELLPLIVVLVQFTRRSIASSRSARSERKPAFRSDCTSDSMGSSTSRFGRPVEAPCAALNHAKLRATLKRSLHIVLEEESVYTDQGSGLLTEAQRPPELLSAHKRRTTDAQEAPSSLHSLETREELFLGSMATHLSSRYPCTAEDFSTQSVFSSARTSEEPELLLDSDRLELEWCSIATDGLSQLDDVLSLQKCASKGSAVATRPNSKALQPNSLPGVDRTALSIVQRIRKHLSERVGSNAVDSDAMMQMQVQVQREVCSDKVFARTWLHAVQEQPDLLNGVDVGILLGTLANALERDSNPSGSVALPPKQEHKSQTAFFDVYLLRLGHALSRNHGVDGTVKSAWRHNHHLIWVPRNHLLCTCGMQLNENVSGSMSNFDSVFALASALHKHLWGIGLRRDKTAHFGINTAHHSEAIRYVFHAIWRMLGSECARLDADVGFGERHKQLSTIQNVSETSNRFRPRGIQTLAKFASTLIERVPLSSDWVVADMALLAARSPNAHYDALLASFVRELSFQIVESRPSLHSRMEAEFRRHIGTLEEFLTRKRQVWVMCVYEAIAFLRASLCVSESNVHERTSMLVLMRKLFLATSGGAGDAAEHPHPERAFAVMNAAIAFQPRAEAARCLVAAVGSTSSLCLSALLRAFAYTDLTVFSRKDVEYVWNAFFGVDEVDAEPDGRQLTLSMPTLGEAVGLVAEMPDDDVFLAGRVMAGLYVMHRQFGTESQICPFASIEIAQSVSMNHEMGVEFDASPTGLLLHASEHDCAWRNASLLVEARRARKKLEAHRGETRDDETFLSPARSNDEHGSQGLALCCAAGVEALDLLTCPEATPVGALAAASTSLYRAGILLLAWIDWHLQHACADKMGLMELNLCRCVSSGACADAIKRALAYLRAGELGVHVARERGESVPVSTWVAACSTRSEKAIDAALSRMSDLSAAICFCLPRLTSRHNNARDPKLDTGSHQTCTNAASCGPLEVLCPCFLCGGCGEHWYQHRWLVRMGLLPALTAMGAQDHFFTLASQSTLPSTGVDPPSSYGPLHAGNLHSDGAGVRVAFFESLGACLRSGLNQHERSLDQNCVSDRAATRASLDEAVCVSAVALHCLILSVLHCFRSDGESGSTPDAALAMDVVVCFVKGFLVTTNKLHQSREYADHNDAQLLCVLRCFQELKDLVLKDAFDETLACVVIESMAVMTYVCEAHWCSAAARKHDRMRTDTDFDADSSHALLIAIAAFVPELCAASCTVSYSHRSLSLLAPLLGFGADSRSPTASSPWRRDILLLAGTGNDRSTMLELPMRLLSDRTDAELGITFRLLHSVTALGRVELFQELQLWVAALEIRLEQGQADPLRRTFWHDAKSGALPGAMFEVVLEACLAGWEASGADPPSRSNCALASERAALASLCARAVRLATGVLFWRVPGTSVFSPTAATAGRSKAASSASTSTPTSSALCEPPCIGFASTQRILSFVRKLALHLNRAANAATEVRLKGAEVLPCSFGACGKVIHEFSNLVEARPLTVVRGNGAGKHQLDVSRAAEQLVSVWVPRIRKLVSFCSNDGGKPKDLKTGDVDGAFLPTSLNLPDGFLRMVAYPLGYHGPDAGATAVLGSPGGLSFQYPAPGGAQRGFVVETVPNNTIGTGVRVAIDPERRRAEELHGSDAATEEAEAEDRTVVVRFGR
ncbi:hypothetical protein FVE85_9322 [Porphyridium purpureum]|uniref:Uncharacterized protein n=1 Tax=Porphyridium purpureum TaxID=35688 RepID=A0A5J4YQ11_PORPP|nr:hypothetical protein FVE85_9322 [Porphyridium purpureum]|eukprot:POR9077..scf222_8